MALTPCLLHLSRCVCFSAGPNSKAESNLVDEVSEVVDQIERCIISMVEDQIAEEVTSWIDRPSNRHNELHDRVRGLHVRACVHGFLSSLTCEHFLQNVTPTCHSENPM